MAAQGTQTVARTSHGWLLFVLLTPLFMYQADVTIVNVATPSMHAHLGASGPELELVISGYLVASATLFITGARLGEIRGYKRVFLAGLCVFALASLVCGLSPSPAVLIVARVAQGAGGALMIPQVLTGIQLNFTGQKRAHALSLYTIALAGGAVCGQILGGVLVSANLLGASWRPIFLINVPIAACVLVAGKRFLPEDLRTDSARRVDLGGVITLSGALLAIVLSLTLGREQGWPMWTWACLVSSIGLLAAFVAIERRVGASGGSPLVNLHVLLRPAVFWGLWPQPVAVSTYYALLFTLALYLQQGLGKSPMISGLVLVPWVAAFGIPGRLIGRMPARLRPKAAPAGCLMLAGAYCLISASTFAGGKPSLLLLALLALGGFGLGANMSAILDHLTTAATPRYASDISGVFTTSLQVAGAIGTAILGTVYLTLSQGPGPANATHAFAIITAVFSLVALGACALAYKATRLSPLPRDDRPA